MPQLEEKKGRKHMNILHVFDGMLVCKESFLCLKKLLTMRRTPVTVWALLSALDADTLCEATLNGIAMEGLK